MNKPSESIPSSREIGESVTDEPRVLIIERDNPIWQRAEAIEAEVFVDAEYVKSADELRGEYEDYDSFFFAMVEGGDIKGVLRIIRHSPGGFKTLNDVAKGELVIDDEWLPVFTPDLQAEIFEVGTIGVPKENRTKDAARASLWLYGAVLGYSRREKLPNAIASFDADYFEGFKGLFGDGLRQMGPPIHYMGSDTVPVYMTEASAYASICLVDPTGEIQETLDLGAQHILDA